MAQLEAYLSEKDGKNVTIDETGSETPPVSP
jgi:hypothetical protein